MSRTQWWLFGICLPGFLITLNIFAPRSNAQPSLISIPLAFLAVLIGGTFVWSALRFLRNAWIRHIGVPVTGWVIHARSSGSVNHVPNWEIEVELPGGATARLMALHFGGFEPREPIDLLVDPKNPSRAVLPPHRRTDF